VQSFGQQALVYDLTHSEFKLGLITFLGAVPMFFGPLFGWVADRCNKRVVLVCCQVSLGLSALVMFFALSGGWASFELMCVLAFWNGVTSIIEIPTRQSLISRVVPPEDIASAIPMNAAAFNGARVIGPMIGGILFTTLGYSTLYLVNAISFLALIFAILGIKADLTAAQQFSSGLRETLFEGVRYVAQVAAFRLLVLLLVVNSLFGLCYFSQLAAFTESHLGAPKSELSSLMTTIGIGAIIGLVALAAVSRLPLKGWVPLISIVGFGASLLCFSFAHTLFEAKACGVFLGLFSAGHMAGTNTALQYFAPAELRGRVVSVHAWALGGVWPLGALLLGKMADLIGLISAFRLGACVVLAVGLSALVFGSSLKSLKD